MAMIGLRPYGATARQPTRPCVHGAKPAGPQKLTISDSDGRCVNFGYPLGKVELRLL